MSLRDKVLKEIEKILQEQGEQAEEQGSVGDQPAEDSAKAVEFMPKQTIQQQIQKCVKYASTNKFWATTCNRLNVNISQKIENFLTRDILQAKIPPRRINRVGEIQNYINSIRKSGLQEFPDKIKYPNISVRLNAILNFIKNNKDSVRLALAGPVKAPAEETTAVGTKEIMSDLESRRMMINAYLNKLKTDASTRQQDIQNVLDKFLPKFLKKGSTPEQENKAVIDATTEYVRQFKGISQLPNLSSEQADVQNESQNWLEKTREETSNSLFQRLVESVSKKSSK